ncbi:hypothetical protein FH972_026913 [Carpinus fangiana]|uniref:Uncharacterized protein n=1 Tax=Carpinus fangiana TaxID=176857 RepID=A0A5N6L5E4_9ROSI|nr:hypothetical protein FH972_026913 [Carpinus fangiana]
MAAARPQVTLHAVPHADGSASFSHGGFSILAVANGPLEAQRRDELPDEAFVEVSVRPASGAGSNIPLRCTCTAVLVDVLDSGNAQSGGRHVFAFAGPSGECLLAESEGEFSLQEWQQAEKQAQRQCRGDNGLELWLRRLIEDDLGTRGRWRDDTA